MFLTPPCRVCILISLLPWCVMGKNRNCWPGDEHCDDDADLHPALVQFRARDCGANFSLQVSRKEESTSFDVPVSEIKDLSYFLRPSYQVFGCELPGVPIDGRGMIHLSDTITRIKIDVGLASRAPNTQLWLENIPGLVVFGFEPNLQAVSDMLSGRSDRGLSHATEPHLDQKYVGSQMFLLPVALGSSRGQEDFYATKNPACSSLLEPDVKKILDFGAGAECGESEMYPVAVLTLSDLLSKIPWGSEGDSGVFPIVEHIKTDAQGYDVEVLRGAGRYLSERVVCVTAEKFAWVYTEPGHSEKDLIDFMYHEGFVLSLEGFMFQYHEVFAVEDTDMDLTFYNTNLSDWWEDVDCSGGDSFVVKGAKI